MALLLANGKSKSAIEQYQDLVHFYAGVDGDPPNCVTLDLLDQLDAVEQQLVALTVGDSSVQPNLVLHCETFDLKTRACIGLEADDMHVRETDLLRRPAQLPRSLANLTFRIAPGYPVSLIAVYGGSGAAVHAHRRISLAKVPFQNNTVNVRSLSRFQHPVIIAIFQGADQLHFRKFVWFF